MTRDPEKKRIAVWGSVGNLIAGLFKAILWLPLVVVLIMTAFFAWRSSQPMVSPQYHGMTYLELLQARNAGYHNKALAYQNAHPEKTVLTDMCFRTETFHTILAFPLVGGINLYYYFHPEQYYLHKAPYEDYVIPMTVGEIFPAWWENYERFVWGMYTHIGPVAYCNITAPVGP